MPRLSMGMLVLMAFLVACARETPLRLSQERINFDFETGDLQGWVVAGGRLGQAVSDLAWSRNVPGMPYPKQSLHYLSTLDLPGGGFDDSMTGTLESPVFVLGGPEISFYVGGGSGPQTYVALCTEDGREYIRARGAGTERMLKVEWNVPALVGQRVFIDVVDRATGPWGHVTFDDFKARGRIDPAATARVRKTFARRERLRQEKEREMATAQEQERRHRSEQLMDDKYLFACGPEQVYQGDNLSGIFLPVGGIGTGPIQMDGKARRPIWQIFNNFEAVDLPDTFFAVRARAEGAAPVVRALQTAVAGPFTPVTSLTFRGEYPFGWYEFADDSLPVRVSLEAFNPFIPLDAKDSAIPCAIFNLTAENRGSKPVEVSFLATQQNAVGYAPAKDNQGAPAKVCGRAYPTYGGNTNRIERGGGSTLLHMTSNRPADLPGSGDMALALLGAEQAPATAQWADPGKLHDEFSSQVALTWPAESKPSPAGWTVNGALVAPLMLAPGERKTATFVLTWYFPNVTHGERAWGGKGNMYANWWPDALAVARDVAGRIDDLTARTRLYHDTFYQTNLPRWLLDRMSSQMAILRSKTCFWTKDGYFGTWEGCGSMGGSCVGNCSHVWHYAQGHARLFPEIGRRMREEELGYQREDGRIPHRQREDFDVATDGEFGAILGAWREHLLSPDRRWLDGQWPHVKRALDHAIRTWDPGESGALAGAQWNTLDDSLGGSTSWMGTLYLASLAAGERMATLEGEPDLAKRYAAIRERGEKIQDATLFNGEYYEQIPDRDPRKDYGQGCAIDQVLGQWWAHQLDLGWLYPPDHVRSALGALVKYNFHPACYGLQQAPRKFVSDEDSGLQMITWPRGGRLDDQHRIYYADEFMTGFEYAAAAAMVQAGMLQDGFMVVRAIADRYDGRMRTDLTPGDWASWGYSGNPFGDDECGKFYGRALSVWSMLLATQGFIYDGPAGRIGFNPKWKPADHVSFWSGAEGWGLYTQRRDGVAGAWTGQTGKIEIKAGRLAVRTLVFGLPEGLTPRQVTVRAGEREVGVTFTAKDGLVEIALGEPLTLQVGEALTVRIM